MENDVITFLLQSFPLGSTHVIILIFFNLIMLGDLRHYGAMMGPLHSCSVFGVSISMLLMFLIVRTCFGTPTPFSPSHNQTKKQIIACCCKAYLQRLMLHHAKVLWLYLSQHRSIAKILVLTLTILC